MDKIHARNGVCKQDGKKDNSGNPRQVPNNARRRESKGSQEHQPQLRTNNNNAGQTQQHYRNNSERRSRWNKLQAAAPNYNSQIRLSASSEASGLGDEDADDHEDIYLETAEWDSVMVPGSKKHNLNHLLNFHYAPIHTKRESHHQWQGRSSKKQSASSAVVYNKDQFLQANCNFIVSDTGDYKGHYNNPDTLVDWQLIEEVVIRSAEEPKCPICLFPPVAAKMTKCGHVYCWPCILHYLALSDKEWRKCPICYDAVRIKDLRSTVAWPYHEYQLEETVDFQLMCRKKGSLDVVRVGRDEERGGVKRATQLPHLFDVREQQIVHSKLILANKVEVSSILERERCELQAQMQTDGPEGFNTPETMFISQAMDLLEDRTKELQKCISVGGSHNYSNNATVAECDGDTDDTHYFYQAVDGQHLYMHSLNLRMLQAQFGSLAICPPVMTGRIVQREHFSVCEGLRKRSKYLQHLPLTSIICVAEVAFREEVFTAEVHGMFAEEMAQRKRDRQKRTRDEKKRERKINDLNEREMGKFLAQSAGGGFVSQAADFYPFLITAQDEVMLEDDDAEGAVGGSFDDSEASAQPFSFAKMLQCTSEIEKAQPQFWPTLENKKTPMGGPQSVETSAWPGRAEDKIKARTSRMDQHFPNLLDTIEVEDEQVDSATPTSPLPTTASKGTASSNGPKGNNNNITGTPSSSKRAPKKKQQQLLFSLGM